MRMNLRRLALFVTLAAFLCIMMSPSALHAQSTQSQTSSTTTKSKKKSKKKKKEKAEKSEANANAPTDNAAADTSKATTKSRKKSRTESKAAESSASGSSNSATEARNSGVSSGSNAANHAVAKSSVHAQTPPSPGMVWVSTGSKVYHKSGSRWYGKTKEGKWMTEADAQRAGYKAAKN